MESSRSCVNLHASRMQNILVLSSVVKFIIYIITICYTATSESNNA